MDMEYALWQLCQKLAKEKTTAGHVQTLENLLMRLMLAPQTGVLQRRLNDIKTSLSKMRHLTLQLLKNPEDTKSLSHLLVHVLELRTLLIKELLYTLDKLELRLRNLEMPVHPLNHGSLTSAHNSLTFAGTLVALDKQFLTLAALCDLLLAEAMDDTADVQPLIPKIVTILGLFIDHKNKLPEAPDLPHQKLMEEFLGKLRQTYNLKLLQKTFKRVF